MRVCTLVPIEPKNPSFRKCSVNYRKVCNKTAYCLLFVSLPLSVSPDLLPRGSIYTTIMELGPQKP